MPSLSYWIGQLVNLVKMIGEGIVCCLSKLMLDACFDKWGASNGRRPSERETTYR